MIWESVHDDHIRCHFGYIDDELGPVVVATVDPSYLAENGAPVDPHPGGLTYLGTEVGFPMGEPDFDAIDREAEEEAKNEDRKKRIEWGGEDIPS
jgi:hypothetical protein